MTDPRYFAWLYGWGGWLSPEDGDPLRLGIEFDFSDDLDDHAVNEADATLLRERFGGEISMERIGRDEAGLPDRYVFAWTLCEPSAQVAFLKCIEEPLAESALLIHDRPQYAERLAQEVQLVLPLLQYIVRHAGNS